jgi:hypothetical protein
MSCEEILDKVYQYADGDPRNPMPLLTRISIGLHLVVCPDCAQEVERFQVCRDMLSMEDTSLAMMAPAEDDVLPAEGEELSGGFSFRGWVIAGLVMLVSLATAFFGLDFNRLAKEMGMSFLLPIGITIGLVLTVYGALFIGSHLKVLTERFGLCKRI